MQPANAFGVEVRGDGVQVTRPDRLYGGWISRAEAIDLAASLIHRAVADRKEIEDVLAELGSFPVPGAPSSGEASPSDDQTGAPFSQE